MPRSRLLPLCIALFTPVAAYAAAPRTFQEFANTLVVLMGNASIVLVVLGLAVFLYGVSTNIFNLEGGKAGSGSKLKATLLWGVIALFVMVSVWGILQLLQNSLFGGDANSSLGNTNTQQLDFQQ